MFFCATFVGYVFVKNVLVFNIFTAKNVSDYSDRILLLSFYFLLPFVFVVFNKLQNYKDKAIPGIMLLAYCLIIGANFFNSYPVKDDYFNAKFVNLSQADIDSVKFIEEKSESPHIVLANQMVGAAAIKEF